MNQITKVFNYEGMNVRTVIIDNEPWFVAKDVCEVLEVNNPSQALSRLDIDEKNTIILNEGNRGNPNQAVVNEPGLYSLIMGSRKPEAKKFKRWVTHDVLPAIRKHGGYLTPQKTEELLANPDLIIGLATALKEERERAAELENKIVENEPYTELGKALYIDNNNIYIGELAKLITQNGYKIGELQLFQWLRDNGYLSKDKRGGTWNDPFQRYVSNGLFIIKRGKYNKDGKFEVNKTTMVTPKGQVYFFKKFIPKREIVVQQMLF